MRKLLMASAAILGATGGLALAQTPAAPSQGQLVAPYGAGPATTNNNNAWGIANTPTGSAAAGPLSTMYAPNTDAVPAPGTIVIRLNGRIVVDFTANYTTGDKSQSATGAYSGYKLLPFQIGSYARLYPAFDGLAANGLRYGASLEIRENFASGTFSANNIQGSANAATTLTQTPTAGATSPSANSSAETLFVRRDFVYLASDQVGIVRVGQADGVLGLFDNCIFTSQCWDATGEISLNGSTLQSTSAQAGLGIPFVWIDQAGAEYDNQKIVYLSPQYYGFDFGAQFAPSMGNSLQDTGTGVTCTQAGSQCINVSSGTDPTRWYNQIGAGLRFQQNFGALDVKAYGFYETAGKEDAPNSQYTIFSNSTLASRTGGTANVRYDRLSFYKAGLAVTAANLTYAIDYIGGDIGSSGQLAMKPTSGVNLNAVVTGLTYFNGPLSLGAEFAFVNGQGAAQLVGISQRREYEAAFGGAYRLAPGLALIAGYMYEHRHQGNFDFNTGGIGGLTVDAQSNSFLFATALNW